MGAELKPCRKCKGPVEVMEDSLEDGSWFVRCDCEVDEPTFPSRLEAVEDWNRRAGR